MRLSVRSRRGCGPVVPRDKRMGARVVAAALATCVLTGTLVLGACGGGGVPFGGPTASPTRTASPFPSLSPVALTAAEKAWLAKKGTLQVGGFQDYPPFGFTDASGQPAGIAVDYWKLMCERLGVQVSFTPMLFADQIAGLKGGKFDSLEGIFPLQSRAQWFAFSRPYFVIETRIYVSAANIKRSSLKALKGLKVAVVASDSGQEIADRAHLKTVVVASYPQAVKAVASGKAGAAILDQLVGDYFIGKLSLTGSLRPVGLPVAHGQMTMPVRKDDTVLLGILNKGISMIGMGELQKIYVKWVGQ